MPALVISPAARGDLAEIGDFIALDAPRRAQTFVEEMLKAMEQVAACPRSFTAREDLAPGLRVAPHRRYLIFFTDTVDSVTVVRVLHAARDLPRVFGT